MTDPVAPIAVRDGSFVVYGASPALNLYQAARWRPPHDGELVATVRAARAVGIARIAGSFGVATNMGGAVVRFEVEELVRGKDLHAALLGGHMAYPGEPFTPDADAFVAGQLYAVALSPLPGAAPCGADTNTSSDLSRKCVDADLLAAVPITSRADGTAWIGWVMGSAPP